MTIKDIDNTRSYGMDISLTLPKINYFDLKNDSYYREAPAEIKTILRELESKFKKAHKLLKKQTGQSILMYLQQKADRMAIISENIKHPGLKCLIEVWITMTSKEIANIERIFGTSNDVVELPNDDAYSTVLTCFVFSLNNFFDGLSQNHLTPGKDTKRKLFSNEIDNRISFGISRKFADRYNRLLNDITPESAINSYERYRITFNSENSKDVSLRIIDSKKPIQSYEQFYDTISQIKKGKVLQTLLALWHHANLQGKFIFNGARLSEIMRTVLKPPKTGYYTQTQKREFTTAIHVLRNLEISLDSQITDKDDRGRKKTMVKREYYRLIDIDGAVYAKNRDGKPDESVIVKLYGELLPKFNKGIMRGRLYSRGLLELDANKDEKALLLGFMLLTRFDQIRMGKNGEDYIPDERLFIRADRKTFIRLADYTKTEKINKTMANQQLIKTLNKLIEVNCIQDYEPKRLTTDDDILITVHAMALRRNNENDMGMLKHTPVNILN